MGASALIKKKFMPELGKRTKRKGPLPAAARITSAIEITIAIKTPAKT